MNELKIISIKIPEEVYRELLLKVPEGQRSSFIRDAIVEKLSRTPKPDKILELEGRLKKLEEEYSRVRKYFADLELLTYGRGSIDPHAFCMDEVDRGIIDYLMHYRGATTPELAEHLQANRWLILNRLRRIERKSQKQLGKSIVEYFPGERMGKKRAWWINEEIIGEETT
ncbi:MAG: hypothetical protein N3F10_06345 [Candidatus Bathyarchaeota archaeon]|nr:hypothetical protein [Candidatus Bathyarchaeota archaeon]